MNETDAKVGRGVAALYFSSIAALVLNLLFIILLTNYYGSQQSQVGLFSYLNVLAISAATVAVLALPIVGSGAVATPPAVTRFLTSAPGGWSPPARRVYILSVIICSAVSSAFLLLAAYRPAADLAAGPGHTGPVFAAAVDAAVYAFGQLGAYAMLGTDKATSAGKLIIAASALRYLFASLLLLDGMGPTGIFLGFAAGDALLAIGANGLALKGISLSPDPGSQMRPVVKYMISVFFAALVGLAVSQADKLLAVYQKGYQQLAFYNIATVGAAVASFAPSAATNVLVPALSKYASQQGDARELLRSYTRHISLSAVPIGFVLAAVSPFLLRIFGDAYAVAAPVMALIAISISFTAVSSVYASALLVYDRAHHFTYSNLVALASLIVVAVLTVPALGILGVALGRAVMLGMMLVFVAYFARPHGWLVLDAEAYLKSIGASALMAAVIFLVLRAGELVGLNRIELVAGSILMVPLGLALYLASMKMLKAFKESDMDFIDTLLPSYLRWLSRLGRKLL